MKLIVVLENAGNKFTGSRDDESSSKNLGFGKTYKYVMIFRLVFVSSAEL